MQSLRYWVPAMLALLVAASGWFYMFYSRAAHRLEGIEADPINRKRRRLRQINGFVMMILGFTFYAGSYAIDLEHSPLTYMLTWIGALFLLLIMVVLALIDVRMTMALRGRRKKNG